MGSSKRKLNIVEEVVLIIEIQIRRKLILSIPSLAPHPSEWENIYKQEFRPLTETSRRRLPKVERQRKPNIIRHFVSGREERESKCVREGERVN